MRWPHTKQRQLKTSQPYAILPEIGRQSNTFKAAKIVAHIHHEMGLHIEYCNGFGITKEEMEASEEHQGENFGESFLQS
jgi:hypothetical protein